MVAAVVAVLLVGCGSGDNGGTVEAPPNSPPKSRSEDGKLRSIRLTLESYSDSENVGILIADQRGYFADVGLDVAVLAPVAADNVPEYVAQGVDYVGVLPQPQLVISRARGMPLVAIGSLVGRPTMAMIWPRQSKISGIADLKGKTIAIDGFPYEERFLESLLGRAGLTLDDVKVKSAGYLLVPALVKGRADAIFGGSWNVEGVELEARGLEPVITPVQRLGIPSYEEAVLITGRNRLSRNPRLIRGFMAAVARGTATALEDPEAAAEAIAISREEIGRTAVPSPALTKAKLEATLPLLSRAGRMSSGRAARLVGWMEDQGLIRRRVPPAALLTNRYLPEGVAP
jgi:putative hydroxymethylpyrimidine transport system substrate-binding protein